MKTQPAPSISPKDALKIGRLDAHDQAVLVKSGQLTATELVEAAITRIEVLNPRLNAVSYKGFDNARKKASQMDLKAPLAGVPCLLKDGLDYPGMPANIGSRFRAAHPSPAGEYEYTRRLDKAGLIALGKTNAPEFGLLPTTEPLLYGPAVNPWAPGHSPGGSSGGSAVAVASGMVPLAHAADGGGSIRIPASCSGVFGMKPGRGGNVRARAHHIIEDLLVGDTLLSKTVRDSAWAIRQTYPGNFTPRVPQKDKAPLKIVVVTENFWGDEPHPDVADVIRKTADLCTDLGHDVAKARLPVDGPAVAESFRTIWGYLAGDVMAYCSSALRKGTLKEWLEPWTLELAAWSRSITTDRLDQLFDQTYQATAALNSFFQTHDMILSPVLKEPPVEIGRLGPTRPFKGLMEEMFDYISYTPLHNLTGMPAMSVPLYMSPSGLPIGSMFAAHRGQEELLLDLAFQLEGAEPWASRWPELDITGPNN